MMILHHVQHKKQLFVSRLSLFMYITVFLCDIIQLVQQQISLFCNKSESE